MFGARTQLFWAKLYVQEIYYLKAYGSSAILLRDPENCEATFLETGHKPESRCGECCTKLLAVETVLSRMNDETAKKKIGVEGRVNLFTVEEPASNKHPCDFTNPFCPVLQVMNDAEIEDGIHAGVRVREVLRVGNEKKGKTPCIAVETFLCELDHQWIDIHTIHPPGVKRMVNEFYPLAPAAADLETKGS